MKRFNLTRLQFDYSAISNLTLAVLVTSALFVIIQVYALALYTFPHADDYCRLVDLAKLRDVPLYRSATTLTAESYFNWNSRWATMAAHYLVLGGIDGYRQYPIPLLALGLLRLLSLVFLFASILEFSVGKSILLGVLLEALLLANTPSLSEGAYWLTGVVEYEFPLTCGIVLCGLLYQVKPSKLSTGFFTLAVFIIAGQHEFMAVMLGSIFGAVWYAKRTQQAGDTKRWALLFCVALAGLSLLLLAPGTWRRAQTAEPMKLYGFLLARFAGRQLIAHLPRWVFAPAVFLGALLWADWLRRTRIPAWLADPLSRKLIPALATLLTVMAIVAAPVFGGYQANRSLNWGFTVLIIGLLLTISAYREFFRLELSSLKTIPTAAMLVLAGAFYFSPNAELARLGLQSSLPQWRRTMLQRINLKGEDVVLPAVEPPSPLLNNSGVKENKDHWLNRCIAAYLQVRSIVPEKSGAAPNAAEH